MTPPVVLLAAMVLLGTGWQASDGQTAAFRKLEGNEILEAISGKRLGEPVVRPNPTISGLIPAEYFYPDGRWDGTWEMSAAFNVPGRWTIENDKLCVSAKPSHWAPNSFCRSLWRDDATGQLSLSPPQAADSEPLPRSTEALPTSR